ncbi:hypothetical protein X777_03855 [Ooceraea biroi]|uniref:Uncharacterized protein n=1 Tax=Ooceraea biroi TaxID=2015173 RepID=A0A026WHX8_OOCBI|nr:hypothetical protein X777_03855 [Ooceraea biroi]
MLVLCLLITCAIHANAYERNGIRNIKDYVLDKEPVERQLFHLKKYGFKVDVKVIPSYRNGSAKSEDDDDEDHFPAFPVRDIGKCIFEFSLGCIRKRFVRYLETISSLDEITLHGQDVKLVKSRAVSRPDSARAMNDSDVSIQRTVDDFFDSFILRITLPRWNNKREKNQIDVMMDETAVEGRRKGGGGGGGGLGGCGGGKKGGCNMMMMGMIMMIKMKLLGKDVVASIRFFHVFTNFINIFEILFKSFCPAKFLSKILN